MVLESLHPLHQVVYAGRCIYIVRGFVDAINASGLLPALLPMFFQKCPLVDKVHQVLNFFPVD